VFTQPVSPPGVPAQFVEHIVGEVYVDSLAAPAGKVSAADLASPFSSSSSSPLAGSSPCGGKSPSGKTTAGGSTAAGGGTAAGVAGGTAAGGASASGVPSSGTGGSSFASGTQPGASGGGSSLPASFAAALRKPLWLLLAYLVWQALVVGTGASLWNWRREEAS
jgi:hypothetical protein